MFIVLESFQALSSKELFPAHMIQGWLFHAHIFQWKWDDFYVEVLDSIIKELRPCNLEPFKMFPSPHLTSVNVFNMHLKA